MVRTADYSSGTRVGGKAPKAGRPTSSNDSSRSRSPSSSGERGFGGYNSVCPRETPSWQKPITAFFQQPPKNTKTNKQTTSKNVSDDISMVDGDEQTKQVNTKIDENVKRQQPQEIELGKNDKENCSPNEQNSNDAEMKEPYENSKKKVNPRDDSDDSEVPAKKFKLDANMCEMMEQSEDTV